MNWHLARGSGPCMLLQWSKSKPSSVLSPSRRQLNFMANGRSWPISGYGSSSRAVLAHSWKSSGSKPRISRCSKASLIHVRAVSSGPTLNVLHCRQNSFHLISEQDNLNHWLIKMLQRMIYVYTINSCIPLSLHELHSGWMKSRISNLQKPKEILSWICLQLVSHSYSHAHNLGSS